MAGDRSGASHGSTGRAIPTVTALRNITGQRTWAWPIKAGRIRTTRSFMTMDDSQQGPIALAEVQGYVYAAKLLSARGARRLGWERRAIDLESQAQQLAARFEAAFWCPEIETYALALDGAKKPCRVRTSNAGQLLFTGIARPERAAKIVRWIAGDRTCSRVGASARSRTGSSGTIPCPITTVQSGRMTTLSLRSASRDTDTRRPSSRYSKACLRLRPIWSCAAFRSCSAGFSAGGDEVQRSIRSPVRRRPGQAGRFS